MNIVITIVMAIDLDSVTDSQVRHDIDIDIDVLVTSALTTPARVLGTLKIDRQGQLIIDFSGSIGSDLSSPSTLGLELKAVPGRCHTDLGPDLRHHL
ncbi:hypothetical protein OC835_004541, partial [Tilletia horrida]